MMTQPGLFTHGDNSIPGKCRAAAFKQSHKHRGHILKVISTYEERSSGCTADHVADLHGLVLNTARRCVFDLAEEGLLIPMGIGMSRNFNPQTIYVHRNHAALHQDAIKAYKEKHLADKKAPAGTSQESNA